MSRRGGRGPARRAPRKVAAPAAPSDARPTTRTLTAVSLILALAAVLVFTGLSARPLWEDEAETALLAQNILRFGIPRAFDGTNLVSQEAGRDSDEHHVWRWTPWLDKYVAATSFGVLGASTFAARLPFALVGLACVLSVYVLALRLFGDRRVALASMAFLTLSVPFLLYARQCRYYSLAMLGAIWTVYGLRALVENRRRAGLLTVGAMTVLFHSNYLVFLATAVAGAAACALLYRDRALARRLGLVYGAAVLLNLPWFWFFGILGKRGEERVSSVWENLGFYLVSLNEFSLPLAAVLVFAALVPRLGRRRVPLDDGWLRACAFLAALTVVYMIVVAFAPWSFFRYLVPLLPVSAILCAAMSVQLWSRHAVVGLVFGLCLLLTGLFHGALSVSRLTLASLPPWEVRSFPAYDLFFPLGNYLHELTHDFRGPIEGIVRHLRAHARPADRVYISYGDLPVMFHTGLEVRGGQSGRSLSDWPMPDWIVVRSFFRFGNRPSLREDAQRADDFLRRRVRWEEYRKVEIPYIDHLWENIPEPGLHRFRQAVDGPRVEIHQRRRPGE